MKVKKEGTLTTLESEIARIQGESKELRERYDKMGEEIKKQTEERQLIAVEIMKRAGALEVLARVFDLNGGEGKTN